jgi:AraC-like DNA-binding protein
MTGVDELTPGDDPAVDPAADLGGAQAFTFSTDSFPEHERVTAWREVFGRTILKIEVAPRSNDGFQAQARILHAPGLGVIRSRTSAVEMGNTRSLITSDDISLGSVLTGRWSASQFGRTVELHPGDGVLMSNADLGRISLLEECRFVTFGLPREAVAPLLPDIGALFARRIPADNPAFQMLLHYLKLAEQDILATDPALRSAFIGHIRDLLALTLGATRDAAEQARGRGLAAARLRTIQDDIHKRFGRADLSIHDLAARHGVSARYVQRIFEESGSTFTQYLAEQRLAAAYKALGRTVSERMPISTIAFDCGFSDVSHFNRLFRQRFGCTPSDVRNAARKRGG